MLKWSKKLIFWITTSIAILLVLLIIALQSPLAQNYVTNQIINQINLKTRQSAKLSKIKIKWFDLVEIKGLEVKDYNNNRMIFCESVEVNYSIRDLFSAGDLNFESVTLNNSELNLVNYQDTLNINLIEFVNDLIALSGPKKPDAKSPKLQVSSIKLDEFSFQFDNRLADSLPNQLFDYSHFTFEVPGALFKNFLLQADTIRSQIKYFAGKDPVSGLEVDEMNADFELYRNLLSFHHLLLKTPNSIVKDRMDFHFESFSDLGYFTQRPELDIDLRDAVIAKRDIEYFVTIPGKAFTAEVTADIRGAVPRLSVENVRMNFAHGSSFVGQFEFMGLPIVKETFIDARVKHAVVDPEDLELFTGGSNPYLNRLGKVLIEGRFLGFPYDFVAYGDFKTRLGKVSSDLNLKFPMGWEQAKYSGNLKLNGFDMGRLLGENSVGIVNMTGAINGEGLTQQNAHFHLNAHLRNSQFIGYNFKDITAKGQFATEYFNGSLTVTDPNCEVNLEGNVNLASENEQIKIHSAIRKLDLYELGISPNPFCFSANIESDVKELDLDSLTGYVGLNQLNVSWKGKSMKLDSIWIKTDLRNEQRNLQLELPELAMKMSGNFSFGQVAEDFSNLKIDLENYFSTKKFSQEQLNIGNKYFIDFELRYNDLSKYIDLFADDRIYVSPFGVVEGTYYQRQNATLSLFTEIDSINYAGVGFDKNTFEINLSKDLDSLGIIAYFLINSAEQRWNDRTPTRDISVEAVWLNNRINFNGHITQPENKSSANLNGELRLLEKQKVFSFLPSRLIAFDEQWYFNPYNKIIFEEDLIMVDRLELYRNEQAIGVRGSYSDSLFTDLNMTVENFDLKAISAVLPIDLGGIVDGEASLTRYSASDPILLGSDLHIDKLSLDGFEVGNINGVTEWNERSQGLNVEFTVKRASVNTIDVMGTYFPTREDNQLDLSAVFDQANLKLLEPFFTGLFSDFKGYASGDIKVTGTPKIPYLNGKSKISNGQMKFDYLGTIYAFDGDLSFDNSTINFLELNARDRDGDRARLTGEIKHKGFSDISVDLNVTCREFQLLNTVAGENSLYYGTANGTGQISVTGSVSDLLIKTKMTSDKGTKIYIPLTETSEITQKDYITFVDFSDSTSTINIQELVQKSITGVKLDFEIEVTPDAYVELIFDIKTGDIIRGRGKGNLKMILDTSGDFELFGDLEINEGAYNFTLPAIGINKEFNVVPGSTISWYGDPYAGNLNLNATYRQLASFNGYTGEEGTDNKLPFLVVLALKGNMMSPQIDFEIKLDDSQSSLADNVVRDLYSINDDDEQLKKQVFSLLILRRFSPRDSYMGGSFNDIESSLSEFLSNQLSYFISQMDENLEVDVDLTSLNQEALNTFQLRLSYTFLDGRLKVSGGGAVPQGNSSQTNNNTDYMGDWSIRYLLTPDGHFLVKAFSQTEQFASTSNQQRETGVSVQYIKSFDDLTEMISRSRESAMTKGKKTSNQTIEIK